MRSSGKISRRRMLALGAAAGVGLQLPLYVPASAFGANDQIGVGVIGCGRRSAQHYNGRGGQGMPPKEARIVAVADFYLKRAHQWAVKHKAQPFQDYRKLLERKEVDAVTYATPEHWHYLPCIHACQAGKDIYGEQPFSHTIREGQAMVQAVRKYKRIFQTGEQQRSNAMTRKAVELIRNGRIGKVHTVIGYNYPSAFECDFPGQPLPDGLDWDRWCGPNEVVPYHTDIFLARIPYRRDDYPVEPAEKAAVGPGWMSFRPYSGGELPNWGCHGLSMVQWALDMDHSGPVEVWVEPAEKLPRMVYENPEVRDRGDAAVSKSIIHYRFANGVVLKLSGIEDRLGGGGTFIGDKGRITIFREGYECFPKGIDEDPLPADATRVYASDNHVGNFFECVRTRKDPIMPCEAGHRVATLCHLGNIARLLGRSLKWNPEKEVFPGDDEANQHLDCPKRKGYEVPEKV
jgi:predicted dehydrogenase